MDTASADTGVTFADLTLLGAFDDAFGAEPDLAPRPRPRPTRGSSSSSDDGSGGAGSPSMRYRRES